MLRPTPGELLAGVSRELREQVLPHVPAGEPVRALRAALHLLGRLERSWDLLPTYLAADNADLRRNLPVLAERMGLPWSDRAATATADIPGVHDAELRDLLEDNTHLQAELDRLQQEWRATGGTDIELVDLLLALHTRMAVRAETAAGLASAGAEGGRDR